MKIRLRQPESTTPMLSILEPYTLFFVDMDDTLFEERQYVLSGFRAIANHVARWGIRSDEAWLFLQQHFETSGREKIFDHLIQHFLGTVRPELIEELVWAYRDHYPQIHLYPDAAETLKALRSRGRVIIVTDGLTYVQERKFAALELDRLVDRVVFCDAMGFPKPDPSSLRGRVEQGVRNALLIGDRPDHDLALAAALGIDSVRVRTGRFHDVDNQPWKPIADVPKISSLLGPDPTDT